MLVKHSIKEIEYQSKEPIKINRFIIALENEMGHTILSEVEKTKISLTQNKKQKSSLNFMEDNLAVTASSQDLNHAIEDNIEKIKSYAQECIKQAGVRNKDISMVILTGGSTELPAIQKSIKYLCPEAKIYDSDKFGSVARGLSHDALRRFR